MVARDFGLATGVELDVVDGKTGFGFAVVEFVYHLFNISSIERRSEAFGFRAAVPFDCVVEERAIFVF